MIEFAHLCLIPGAVVLGVAIVITAEWPINSMLEKIREDVKLPKFSGMSQPQLDKLDEHIEGGDRIGRLERAFFFVAILIGAPALVGIWLAFKVASKWEV